MAANGKVTKYVRFAHSGGISYGIWENDAVQELEGSIFDAVIPTGRRFPANTVNFLVPCEPTKVIAVGLNYASHRVHVESEEGVFVDVTGRPVSPKNPVVFAKFPTSLIPAGEDIVFPQDATNVHFEGEMALVKIGRASCRERV